MRTADPHVPRADWAPPGEEAALSPVGGPAIKKFKPFRPLALVHKGFAAIVLVACGAASAQSITMASTTSTEQSGLFGHLLPAFKQASGVDL